MDSKKFLYRLGIPNRPHREAEVSAGSEKELPNGTGDLKFDSMSPSGMDALFASEALARETLGRNFKRLDSSMRRVAKSPVFRDAPLDRVAELGGGTGLLGMWLKECGLCRNCDIYDHAAKPLSVGKQWAERIGLQDVSFFQITYADIAAGPPAKNCDFVFAEHAIELDGYPDTWDDSDHDVRECHAFFDRRYHELAAAISTLLKPGCVALIGHGIPAPWALELLCKALRSQNLVIDWSITSNRSGFQLYVGDRGTPLLNSPREEALALICDMMEVRRLPPPEISSQREIFADGNSYLELRFQVGDDQGEISVKQKAGLAFFLERGSEGHEAARIASAGHIIPLVKEGLGVLTKTKNCVVTHQFMDPRVESAISGDISRKASD